MDTAARLPADDKTPRGLPHLPRFGPVGAGVTAARFPELDGMRGWAALSVVCFHMLWESFGLVVPGLRNPVTAFLLNGNLAVAIFFVLSGDALSAGYFAGKGDRSVIDLAIKRHSRLSLPILATGLLVWGLVVTGLDFHRAAAPIVHRQDWLGIFLAKPVTLPYVLSYALGAVYTGIDGAKAIDPFLWTMKTELINSIIVFAILFGFRFVPRAWIVLAVASLILLAASGGKNQTACFFFGLLFAALRTYGVFGRIQAWRWASWLSCGAIALLALLVGFGPQLGLDKNAMPMIAIPLVLAVFCNAPLSRAFAAPLSQGLGKLSFPIYLVQFPVLIAFTSGAIVALARNGRLDPAAALAIGAASILACLLAGFTFLPVERFTHWIGRRLVALVWAGVARLKRSPR